MCGIVGIFSFNEPISTDSLVAATRQLDHRGPELQSHWIAENREVGLGHARLRIIDLETGDQPIANEDEQIRIIANGEFYDFERIRKELKGRGHALRTLSDSEIALHLYEEMGKDCLARLRGEFAFVLWDGANKQLFAARDRFGIKPLFYTIYKETLYLASEIKALFAAGVPARWDHESFYQQLFACLDQKRTLFEGIYQVPPGHFLTAKRGAVSVERYWDLDYPVSGAIDSEKKDAEHIEGFRDKLDEAIRLRLCADVPVGCFLSGGVDSSAVLGLAAKRSAGPIRAFTVTFDEAAYDEGDIARETAKLTGADFHPVPVAFSDFANHIVKAIWHAEILGINPHGVARYLHSRVVHENGYKVVLSGEGSDEILAGYGFARHDWQVTGNGKFGGSANGRNAAARSDADADGLESFETQLGFTPAWLKKMAVQRSVFHLVTDADFEARFSGQDTYRNFLNQFDIAGQLSGREPLIQSLYLWAKSILPNYILFAERMEMAHSVESRLPFLDHHLFEFVRAMPASLLMRGNREKYALREATRHVLTDTVYERPKHPFTAPPITLTVDNPFYKLAQEYLRGPALAAMPFFDQKEVIGLLDSLPQMRQSMRISLDPMLMMILSASILQECFNPS